MEVLHNTLTVLATVVALLRLTRSNKSPHFACMQHLERISAIERQATAINLSLPLICQRAAVPVSTIWRWQHGKTAPNTRTIDSHLGKLERALADAVKEVRRRVA